MKKEKRNQPAEHLKEQIARARLEVRLDETRRRIAAIRGSERADFLKVIRITEQIADSYEAALVELEKVQAKELAGWH